MAGRKDRQGELVIVVDDDPAVRDAVVMLLKSCGWQAIAFASGQAMLTGSFPSAERRCLLVDQQMPAMTGLQLLDRLRSEGNAIPTILMTGLVDGGARLREDARKLGAVTLLEKPLDATELEAAVTRALETSV